MIRKNALILTSGCLASVRCAGPIEEGIRKVIEPRTGFKADIIIKSPYASATQVAQTLATAKYSDATHGPSSTYPAMHAGACSASNDAGRNADRKQL